MKKSGLQFIKGLKFKTWCPDIKSSYLQIIYLSVNDDPFQIVIYTMKRPVIKSDMN